MLSNTVQLKKSRKRKPNDISPQPTYVAPEWQPETSSLTRAEFRQIIIDVLG